MGIPHQKQYQQKTWIKAAEVREYVYCPRAWIYRQRNVKPKLPQEEMAVVEKRLEDGWRYHQDHGQAVCQAARQRRWSANWWYCGLAAAGLAIVLLFWR